MKAEKLYLSDEELDALVMEIEADGLIPAPPDMEEAVLAKIAAGSAARRPRPKRSPAAELWRYSLQVSAAVAAAILLMFTAPSWDAMRPETAPGRGEGRLLETLFQAHETEQSLWDTIFDHNGGAS